MLLFWFQAQEDFWRCVSYVFIYMYIYIMYIYVDSSVRRLDSSKLENQIVSTHTNFYISKSNQRLCSGMLFVVRGCPCSNGDSQKLLTSPHFLPPTSPQKQGEQTTSLTWPRALGDYFATQQPRKPHFVLCFISVTK